MKTYLHDLFAMLLETWMLVVPTLLILGWSLWAVFSGIRGYRKRRKMPLPLRYGRDPD